jgi:hypothetical protein
MKKRKELRYVLVGLTAEEFACAIATGQRRHAESVKAGRRPGHGLKDSANRVDLNINGAAAEVAVAKLLGVPFECRINNFHGADLGENIQVRWRSREDWDLIIRRDDNPNHRYVLVVGQPPNELVVVGWIWGRDAAKRGALQTYGNRPAAYFVPQDQLESFWES